MIANHIHDALGQVRKMQELILSKRNFRGYSGIARALGGVSALAGAVFIYDFFNPWPMVITFFIGELVGGFIFRRNVAG